jgi:hypothetical protein
MNLTRRKTALRLGVVVAVAAMFVVDNGTAYADTGFGNIAAQPGRDSRCLDVKKQDDWYHANARIQIWECSSAAEKAWSSRVYGLEPPSGEFGVRKKLYQIVNLRSGMCMQVRNGGTGNGQTIDQFPCTAPGGSIDASANQLWQVDFLGTNSPTMLYNLLPWSALRVNVAMCLDVTSGNTGNGTLLQQYECNQTNAQVFYGSLQPS